MSLHPVLPHEFPAVAALVNSAYRGESSRAGWTTEADYLDGQRTDAETLAQDLAAKPGAALLLLRDEPGGPILGTVWVEPGDLGSWYLGMLTVAPTLQAGGRGRGLLADAEAYIRDRGGRRVEMTVVSIRDTLIAWYARRGYQPTGEVRPFPYGDSRFGEPRRDDLAFVVLAKDL